MESDKKELDVFRDTPVRYMGYANEVGESFRSLVSSKVVNASYVVSFGYVFLDVIDKMRKTYKIENDRLKNQREITTYKHIHTGIDCLIWQTSASVLIPGFTINRICKLSTFLLNKSGVKSVKILTTGIGLASIPLIIHPIDYMCHYVMDKSLRPLLGLELHLKETDS